MGKAEGMNGWILVEDRLPEFTHEEGDDTSGKYKVSDRVLIIGSFDYGTEELPHMAVAVLGDDDDGDFYFERPEVLNPIRLSEKRVAAWRPIPEFPKAAE